MIVTDKEYYLDKGLMKKLDLMVKRMEGTDDNVLPIDGDEGQGKSELATGICYYVAHKMGRKYTVDNIFFDLDEGIKFAGETKDQIIHFDEGALGLLRTQWQNKVQQKFLQLVMTARKKRHFIVVCIPKFHRLPQYVMEERAIGLIHVYSRRNLQKGRFCYYTKAAKDRLYQDWERKKIKNYRKYYVLHGAFVKTMDKVLGNKGVLEYERKKDKVIMSISQPKKEVPDSARIKIEVETKSKLVNDYKERNPNTTMTDIGKIFGINRMTVSRYLARNDDFDKHAQSHSNIIKEKKPMVVGS